MPAVPTRMEESKVVKNCCIIIKQVHKVISCFTTFAFRAKCSTPTHNAVLCIILLSLQSIVGFVGLGEKEWCFLMAWMEWGNT